MDPVYLFDVNSFVRRHGNGTEREFRFESWELKKINNGNHKFDVWPIRFLQERPRAKSATVLMMVGPGGGLDSKLPQEGESCIMKLYRILPATPPSRDGSVASQVTRSGSHSQASRDVSVKHLYSKDSVSGRVVRVENPCDGWGIEDTFWQKCMAFETEMAMSVVRKLQVALPPDVFQNQNGFTTIPRSDKAKLGATFELRLSKSTREAEIHALVSLVKARAEQTPGMETQVAAFSYLLDFKQTLSFSLFSVFPHLPKDPHNTHGTGLPRKLIERMNKMNPSQVAAWKSNLDNCPNRVCIIPGGPGAGKTFWNLTLAAALNARVLYLLDINGPLLDITRKMVHLMTEICGSSEKYKPWTVIRISNWPYNKLEKTSADGALIELQRKTLERRIQLQKQANELDEETGPLSQDDEKDDYAGMSKSFPRGPKVASLKNKQAKPKDHYKVLNLDEAAKAYYKEHRDTKYTDLKEMVEGHSIDLKELRGERIKQLYREVLDEARFIATTPVTAYKASSALSNAQVIMFDEAPHARELSIMISIANFKPFAWILTGDHRQTKPFVGSYGNRPNVNKYAEQLRVSTMERACRKNPDIPSLLINHRANGNLQELASELFYNSKMVPAVNPLRPGAIPSTVLHLRKKYLMEIKQSNEPDVSRLLVVLKTSAMPTQIQNSWYNPSHQDFVMDLVGKLVDDKYFRQTNGKDRGTILIMSPYKRAFIEYNKAIKVLTKTSSGGHLDCVVEARTVDTSQGHEADFVFFDFVNDRSTKHLEDPNRLCVALTRAKQAEIIIMTDNMVKQLEGTIRFNGQRPLADMVSYCKRKGQFACVENTASPSSIQR